MHDRWNRPMPCMRVFAGALVISQVFSLAALPAQDVFRSADFLDDGYRDIVVVDFAELRDSGVWDELNTGVGKILLGTFEKVLDTSFDRIESFRMVPLTRQSGDGNEQLYTNVMIIEGNTPLGLPDGFDETSWVRDKVGVQEILYREGFPYGYLSPAPDLRIIGSLSHLRSRLEGRKRSSMPSPDIMSLMSTRKDGLLACLVADLTRGGPGGDLVAGIEDGAWPEDDRPEFLLVRLAATGDPDDPNVVLEVVVRHPHAGAGIQETDRAVTSEVDDLIEDPRYRYFSEMLKSREQVVDGIDLSIVVELGRARSVLGHIEMLVGPLIAKAVATDGLLPTPAEPVRDDAPEHRHEHK